MKETFYKVVNNFKNETLKEFAIYCADRLPKYFWEIPASTSGKYHPITDLGEGGLVRHSLMTYKVVTDLIEMSDRELDTETKETLQFSALFHDCCKCGTDENSIGHTSHEHPLIASRFLSTKYYEFSTRTNKKVNINAICSCIESHMGKWNTSKYSDVVLPTPKDWREILVHQADYIASRKYCLFDEEFFKNF